MSDSLEINSNNSISIIDNDAIVLATNNAIDIKYSEPEYDVTVNKKEYIITGDTLYIPKRYEDAPQWLRDIIDNVTDVALSAKISEINNLTQSLNNLIVELEVAKNTYTMSVISSNDINERINTAITTLNSSVMESDATILGLATTKVTPEQAQAISIDAIRTSLNDTISGNSLGSIISGMQETTTTGDYTNAQSIEVLQSTIEGNADSTATAIDTINTFAGIDEAGAYTYTGLTGYLVDPNTGMIGGGQSELQNTITTTGDNVEAKFEYGSNIKIGGQYHNAGFGLKTTMTGGDGTIADPYNSEFWINAEKFKFTNNSMSGQATPFSIDATGVTPKITFNGLVRFGSGQTGTIDEAINSKVSSATTDDIAKKLGYSSYADMVSKASLGQTIINGGYIQGELISANSINAGQIDAYAITGKQITGGTINGTDINGVRITGAIIKASYIDYTTNLALSNWQEFKFSGSPQIPVDNVTINSWSYSGSTVTCTVGNSLIESSYHIRKGNTVLIQNLSCTTNPPNGEYVITEVNYINNTFKFSVVSIPTGTASVSASSKVTSKYDKNFARNSDETNSLVVDNLGYVRLPAQSGFKTTGTIKTFGGDFFGISVVYRETHNETFSIYPWDDHTINTLSRAIYPEVNTNYLSGEFKITTRCAVHSFNEGWDGSHNYYDFYIDFLGDTIQGHAYINTNSSGTNSWRSWYVNGAGVGTGYSKTIKGITYTLSSIPSTEYTTTYYDGTTSSYGTGWIFTMTADFTGNKTITSYNFDDLIKLTRSEGLLYTAIDDGGTIPICVFKHDLKYPVLNVQ